MTQSLVWRVRMLVLLLACGAVVAAACGTPEAPPQRTTLRLTTGTPGAGFYPLSQAIARAWASTVPGLDVQVRDSVGSISNVEALQGDTADIGLAYADVAYMAYAGLLDGRGESFGDLRGVAVLELAPVHLVVRKGITLNDAAGLRGRRVAVGPSGSGSALTAGIVLKAMGVSPTDIHVEPLRYIDAAARLAEGTIDALFVNGGDPVEAVHLAMRSGARLVPLTGPAIDRLRHDYPFFRPTVIAGGTYPGHPAPVYTIGVDIVLVCRRGLDERLVHDLTRQFFAVLPSLSMLHFMDLDQAPATPIPLHEGAARYYRERELSR